MSSNNRRNDGGGGGRSSSRERRRPPSDRPSKRSAPDERNSSSSLAPRHDFGGPMSPARRGGDIGGGRPGFPPPPKFSGAPIPETEMLEEIPRKKFTGRCRLFVGNLSTEMKEPDLKELFSPFGEISECYISGKGFAFLRLDTHAHAESAKEALDAKMVKGRQLRVRFAVHGAAIKVKELSPAVSNEMLNLAFSAFGEVERAIHIVDEKGRPTGEGIVEFERKLSAQDAVNQIRERVFLLTANTRPLQVDFVEPKDEEDGLSEKMIQKTHQLVKEREIGPRFATMNSFEYVYGRRWKDLYEFENKRRKELEVELREQRRNLDADMEMAYEDYKAEMLREELQHRQEELERLDAARRQRQQRQQNFMGGGMPGGPGAPMDGWGVPPPSRDGPLGRHVPQPPSANRGPSGMNGYGQPPIGPEVRKLLQALDPTAPQLLGESPAGRGGQGQRGPPPPAGPGLPFPPPPINVLDRKQGGGGQPGGPIPINLLDRNPGAGGGPPLIGMNPLDRIPSSGIGGSILLGGLNNPMDRKQQNSPIQMGLLDRNSGALLPPTSGGGIGPSPLAAFNPLLLGQAIGGGGGGQGVGGLSLRMSPPGFSRIPPPPASVLGPPPMEFSLGGGGGGGEKRPRHR